MMRPALIACFGFTLLASPVLSQPASPTPAPRAAQQAPFEASLLRLSEVLGSLHYLGNLCGSPGSQWRDMMEKLVAAEAPDEARKARFVASFNRGYRSFAGIYSSCTDSAVASFDRYKAEGETLANETASRFGN